MQDLPGAEVRRTRLDGREELVGYPPGLVPVAAPVAMVDQGRLKPASQRLGTDPLGRLARPRAELRSTWRSPRT